jgi:GcrA cell cycle regulator
MAWTDERISMLKTYWEEGRSASQIAELMGENLSRNAVIGKAHRLGLASRPSPLKTSEAKSAESKPGEAAADAPAPPRARAPRAAPASEPRAEAAPAPATSEQPVAAPPAPMPAAVEPAMPRVARTVTKAPAKDAKVTLLDLNDRICKWPIGHPDEAGFHFCGKPVSTGFPYCGEHCLIAYQAQMPRRDRPAGPSRPFGPNLPRPR